MSNILIARTTLIDAATLYSANNETDYPIGNLLTQQPREVVRSDSNSDWYVEIDLGAAYAVNFIGLLYTNADISTQWHVRGATSQAGLVASPAGYSSGVIDHWPNHSGSPRTDLSTWGRTHAILNPAAQSFRWWRIDVSGLSALSYYQAGRLVIDAAYQPTRNVAIGAALGVEDYSYGAETAAGTVRRAMKQKRNLSVVFHAREETEAYTELLDMDRIVGAGGDLVVCLDPAEYVMERTLYGYMSDIGDLVHGIYIPSFSGPMHQKNYSFVEYEHP
jgi:hypothetical protein